MLIKRQVSDRVLRRFKNMCKMAAVIFFANYILDTSLYNVMKDEIMGQLEVEDNFQATEHAYYESMYGDFESLVNQRREEDLFKNVPSARAAGVYRGELKDLDISSFKISKDYQNREALQQIFDSETTMADLATKRANYLSDPSQNAGDKDYMTYTERELYANGFVEEYYGEQRCMSWMLIPGTTLLNKGLMGFVYLVWLVWCFVGIAIISDIFMESIETITSQTRTIEVFDRERDEYVTIDTQIWNMTMANLTLMALGSSAPEILLNVIQTAQTIAVPPPELGASTIVGSAAFNLLVISGCSIIGVGEEYKKVEQYGVFAITSITSLFAYIWLYLVLKVITPNEVEIWEAVLTFVFFPILLIVSYAADRCATYYKDQEASEAELKEKKEEEANKVIKSKLRKIATALNNDVVIQVCQEINNAETSKVDPKQKSEIIKLYQDLFQTNNLKSVQVPQLLKALQPDSLLERFAYRNRDKADPEFMKMKGTKGQIAKETTFDEKSANKDYGFKCLHYSVTESAGHVEIEVVRKNPLAPEEIGVRTVDDTAKEGKDYNAINELVKFPGNQNTQIVKVPVINDEEWNPDLDFLVELYDPSLIGQENDRLPGVDTRCKVTILDEDFPGVISFPETEVRVSKTKDQVEIKIQREDGSDGQISCMIRAEMMSQEPHAPNSAVHFEHFLPMETEIVFKHGETETTKIITLLPAKEDEAEDKMKGDESAEPEEGSDEADEVNDLIFKVKLEDAKPEGVKISKKNICFVTIVQSDDHDQEEADRQRLLEFYLAQQNPTWSQQFKNAVTLGPVMDEEEHELSDVSAWDAFCHFSAIFWKVFFALVPPTSRWGGYPAFFVALAFIGVVTAVVGEVATVLGCSLGILESVTAITLVALGTSLPDTFASMTAAANSEDADAAIGNITGSNSVNVFLGMGVPWIMGAAYWSSNFERFYLVKSGPLSFSIFVFLVVALICFGVLVARRCIIGGELGGPTTSKYASGIFLFFLWFIYVLMSSLQAYGIIQYE